MVVQRVSTLSDYNGVPESVDRGVHDAMFRFFSKHVSQGAFVLDAGAGYGAMSLRLHKAGYRVEACDLDTSDWRVPEVPVRQLDFNKELPGLEPTYDAIIAVEVIEHLENPRKFLRDCKRMLRQGGRLIFSTPNVLNIDSRRIFVTTGHLFSYRSKSIAASGHLSILPYWLLEEMMELEDYRILARIFLSGAFKRPGLKKILSPLANLLLLPLGLKIPLAAARGIHVAFAAAPKEAL